MLSSLMCVVLCKMSLWTVLDLFVSRSENREISYAMLADREKKEGKLLD